MPGSCFQFSAAPYCDYHNAPHESYPRNSNETPPLGGDSRFEGTLWSWIFLRKKITCCKRSVFNDKIIINSKIQSRFIQLFLVIWILNPSSKSIRRETKERDGVASGKVIHGSSRNKMYYHSKQFVKLYFGYISWLNSSTTFSKVFSNWNNKLKLSFNIHLPIYIYV